MPVSDFYIWALLKMLQHPTRVSLVGLLAAFVEYVEGAKIIAVDRDQYRAYQDDTDVEIPTHTVETFELTFSLSFMEVRLLWQSSQLVCCVLHSDTISLVGRPDIKAVVTSSTRRLLEENVGSSRRSKEGLNLEVVSIQVQTLDTQISKATYSPQHRL